MTEEEKIKEYFKDIDEDKKQFAYDTIEEYCYFLNALRELKKLPYIQVSKSNPQMQKTTPAAKLIKEYSTILDAKRKTLLSMLYRVEVSAADDLLSRLAEFE